MYSDIVEREDTLRRLFDHAADLQKNDVVDLEVRSAFESYLWLRTYAYIETSVRTIFLEYVRSVKTDDSIERFVASHIERQPNLWYSVLIKLMASFNPERTVHFKSGTTEKMRISLDSLVPKRNSIAHGDDVDISLQDLHDYFVDTQKIVRLVFESCVPASSSTPNS